MPSSGKYRRSTENKKNFNEKYIRMVKNYRKITYLALEEGNQARNNDL